MIVRLFHAAEAKGNRGLAANFLLWFTLFGAFVFAGLLIEWIVL